MRTARCSPGLGWDEGIPAWAVLPTVGRGAPEGSSSRSRPSLQRNNPTGAGHPPAAKGGSRAALGWPTKHPRGAPPQLREAGEARMPAPSQWPPPGPHRVSGQADPTVQRPLLLLHTNGARAAGRHAFPSRSWGEATGPPVGKNPSWPGFLAAGRESEAREKRNSLREWCLCFLQESLLEPET